MRRAFFLSLIAGAWAALWVVLPLLVYVGVDPRAMSGMRELLDRAAAEAGLGSLALVGAAACLAFGSMLIASMLLLSLIVRLDAGRRALQALRWIAGTLPCGALWMAAVLASGLLTWNIVGTDGNPWFWVATAFVYGTVPFLCLRGDIVSTVRPPTVWMPRWPGSVSILLALLWFTVRIGFDVAVAIGMTISSTGLRWPAVIAAELIGWVLGLMCAAVAITAWLRRASWRNRTALPSRRSLTRIVIALAAADLRVLWCVVVLMVPPTFSVALHSIFIVPEVSDNLARLGLAPDARLQALRQLAQWSSEWWWLVALPFSWPALAWSARIVHLTAQADDQTALADAIR